MAASTSSPSRDGDFYEALGLPFTASAAEIRAAYRRAALEAHPDRPGGDSARFRSLGRAYAVLSDGARRAEYDARRGSGSRYFGGGGDGSGGNGSEGSFFADDGVVEVDLASLGVVDAALLSVFGRLGVSIRAAPPPAVLEAARTGNIPESAAELSWVNDGEKTDDVDALLRPLSPLPPSLPSSSSPRAKKKLPLPPTAVAGSVARGQADWYRVTLPKPKKRGGGGESSYAIAAHSRAGSRLKLLLFEPRSGSGGGGDGDGGGVWELAASADSVPFVSTSTVGSSFSSAEKPSAGGEANGGGGGSSSRPKSAAAETPTATNGQLALLVASDSFPTLEMRPVGTGASLAATAAAANSRTAGDTSEALFRRLDGLRAREPVPPADPGTELLIAVVGANTFRKSIYSLRAVLLPPSGEEERRDGGGRETSSEDGDDDDEDGENAKASALLALRSTEEALLAQRRELSVLEGKHRAARAALNAVAAEAAAAGSRVEALLKTRDEAYARVLCLNPSSASSSSFSVRSSSAREEL